MRRALSILLAARRIVPEFLLQPGTSCAALLHNLGSYPAQLRQQCCTSYAAMLHKFGNNAAKVWQLRKSKSVLIRGLEHAFTSAKACI